jgi:hypothetical protein
LSCLAMVLAVRILSSASCVCLTSFEANMFFFRGAICFLMRESG